MREIERISDVVGYEETQNAMEVVGISESEREDVFGVVAGVLHLGNRFLAFRGSKTRPSSLQMRNEA